MTKQTYSRLPVNIPAPLMERVKSVAKKKYPHIQRGGITAVVVEALEMFLAKEMKK